jgi:hypothetical protein
MRPVFHIEVCLVQTMCSVPFIVDLKSGILCQRIIIGVLSFFMRGFALLFFVFPVMWTVFYACCEVYQLLAFGQL